MAAMRLLPVLGLLACSDYKFTPAPDVTEGDSAIPEALVIRCAEQWVFAPATLPDGTAVPYPAIRTFVITPRT